MDSSIDRNVGGNMNKTVNGSGTKRLPGFLLICALIGLVTVAFSARLFPTTNGGEPGTRIDIKQWLQLGPLPLPAGMTSKIDSKTDSQDDSKEMAITKSCAASFQYLSMKNLQPDKNTSITWFDGKKYTWKPVTKPGFSSGTDRVLYLAHYLEPHRWLQTNFYIDNPDVKATLYLDGAPISCRKTGEKGELFLEAPLTLTNEKHLLVLKVHLPKGETTRFNTYFRNQPPFGKEPLALSITPVHRVKTEQILNIVEPTDIRVSPDGSRTIVELKHTEPGTGISQAWTEVIDNKWGSTLFSSKNIAQLDNVRWMNRSGAFSFTKSGDNGVSIIGYDLKTHQQWIILKDIKNFSRYWWAPNHSFLVYTTFREAETTDGYRFVDELPAGSSAPAPRISLFMFYPSTNRGVSQGVARQISGGQRSFRSPVISPDGKKIVLINKTMDYENRPYMKDTVYLFDTAAFSSEKLFESNGLAGLSWSPDSRRLLLLGSPSLFDGAGREPGLKPETIVNGYDTQAYIYDLKTREVEAISTRFAPSILTAAWCAADNRIYVIAYDRSYKRAFKYSAGKKAFYPLNGGNGVDVMEPVSFAPGNGEAVYWGSGVTTPPRLYKLKLSNSRVTLLKDYNREAFSKMKLGNYRDVNFKMGSEKFIMGRLYYPVDFSPNRKYPCIVYYYGGTSPVTREFGGRYPKNWYAANGYIVYVLQPTGAIGFGQAASAVHVNDWGKVTSDEIVAAVKDLLQKHPYIDAKRVGAMGASYGGFLTQYLAAKTDIFAAYISHAGITSLASYWGIGDWGYTYSAYATAGSFPWNRKDIYVGHSPLFMADRIQKPLLLLHGDKDNNVPPGESYQMFTALKLLKKDVALITFSDQRHLILEYPKRLRWLRTIIAWWDKHLKNQPEHWNHLYHQNKGKSKKTR